MIRSSQVQSLIRTLCSPRLFLSGNKYTESVNSATNVTARYHLYVIESQKDYNLYVICGTPSED